MNKSYRNINGSVVVLSDNGIELPRPYFDGIESVLVLENQIEFLQKKLLEDEKALTEKIDERGWRLEQSKMVMKAGVVIAPSFSLVMGLVSAADANKLESLFDAVGAIVTRSVPMCFLYLIFFLLFATYPTAIRPSLEMISGYEEKIKYEKETLSLLNERLIELNNNFSKAGTQNKTDDDLHVVDDKKAIKYLKDSINLRYSYGANNEVVMKYFAEETLVSKLKEEGFCDEAIADFVIFVEERWQEIQEQQRLEQEKEDELMLTKR